MDESMQIDSAAGVSSQKGALVRQSPRSSEMHRAFLLFGDFPRPAYIAPQQPQLVVARRYKYFRK